MIDNTHSTLLSLWFGSQRDSPKLKCVSFKKSTARSYAAPHLIGDTHMAVKISLREKVGSGWGEWQLGVENGKWMPPCHPALFAVGFRLCACYGVVRTTLVHLYL